ncbi:hypothetical protein LSAT2_018151 [Lamellibrachia satsuma]|nr:hypothetical protein LSAT2_018151 [Lamellibrachia satsuma]
MAALGGKTDLDVRVRKRVAEQVFQQLKSTKDDDDDKVKKGKPQSPFTLTNILWLVAAAATLYYLEFVTTAFSDPRVHRVWFNVGVILISINITIALFLIIYLSFIKKVDSEEWETRYPAAIPIATGCFCFGALCVTVGLWPVWNLLTPVFLFILFMGFVVIVTMVPSF